jgi:hypothetical protein
VLRIWTCLSNSLVQWKPLNVITVNVIIWFILSVWSRPGHSSNFNSNKIRLMWS